MSEARDIFPDEAPRFIRELKPFALCPGMCRGAWWEGRFVVEYTVQNWIFFVNDAGTWYENADSHNPNADYVQQYIHPGAETIKMGYFPLFILADKGMAHLMRCKLTGEIA